MLTSLRIRNFKAWQDTGPLRLAPLTLIFGANGAGKSSFGQLLLALKQTVASQPGKQALAFSTRDSLIDLGDFAACIHDHDLRRQLGFALQWQLPVPLSFDTGNDALVTGTALELAATLQADTRQQAQLATQQYRVLADAEPVLSTSGSRQTDGRWCMQTTLATNQTTQRDLRAPQHFHLLPAKLASRRPQPRLLQSLPRLTAAMLQDIHYLGPLREPAPGRQRTRRKPPHDLGMKGEHTLAALLAADAAGRTLARTRGARAQPFAAFIARWLTELGIIDGFRLRKTDAGGHEVLLNTRHARQAIRFDQLGSGIARLLPALVAPFYCPPHATVWIEQPELYLHPRLQADLADVCIGALQAREHGRPRHTQLVLESHSEYLLARLQRRIAEQKLSAADVAIYYCRSGGSGAELEELRIDDYGEIANWPRDLFGNEMADLAARTLSAHRRRRQQQGGDAT